MTTVRVLLTKEQQGWILAVRDLPRTRANVLGRRLQAIHLVDDMEGEGRQGLSRAAQRFSATEGISFPPYAAASIDHAIFRFLRKEVRELKLRAGLHVAAAWGASLVVPRSGDELEATNDNEDAALDKLTAYLDAKIMSAAISLAVDAGNACENSERAALLRNLTRALREELLAFGERDQRFFEAIYGGGKTIEEAAGEVGIAYATGKARHRKLLLRLREALERRGFEWIDGPE